MIIQQKKTLLKYSMIIKLTLLGKVHIHSFPLLPDGGGEGGRCNLFGDLKDHPAHRGPEVGQNPNNEL